MSRTDTITFHHLGPADAPLLKRVRDGVFDDPPDPRRTADFLADRMHEIVVARLDGEVVGMATGTVLLHPDKAPQFFVNEVGVADDLLRRGIARRLMERLLAVARGRGCTYIWLGTEVDNHPARALYDRAGGRENGTFVLYEWDESDGGEGGEDRGEDDGA